MHVEPAVLNYVVALCRATRETPSVELGVSPRGAAALLHASARPARAEGAQRVAMTAALFTMASP